ncbi:MAG: MBL fold metallo-hydrolase [Planctomycetota bacterium]|jgi:glyoxylase-like metal-dependent hydrolase (beta-lactamase superfamily II)
MIIDTLVLGDFQTNCFCVRQNEEVSDCLIIDPGMGAEVLVQMLQEKGYTPVEILLTHGHADHIGGVESLRQHWPGVRVSIHKDDAGMLTDPADNLSLMAGVMVQARPAEVLLNSEDRYYEAAGLRFKVLHTPGHTPGGICLYASDDDILFAGDTLFAGSVGRSDFPGGDHRVLIDMIRQKLLILPEKTVVYTGHGDATTIGHEKESNPFLT